MGNMYNINAFDQPGVELGKIYTKAMMGKKGLEKQKKTIETELKAKRQLISF
jgi:glucose-6-phosphate isomerase